MDIDILKKILKKNEDCRNPVFTHAAIHHLENLVNILAKDKLTEKDLLQLKIIRLFIASIDSFPQAKNVPQVMEKDDPSPFLLGEILLNSHGNVRLATELRSKAFYQFLAVGDILALKVNEVTDEEYKLLILYKSSLRFKIEDLKLVASLPKDGIAVELKKDDCIKAAVQGFKSNELVIIVSLDESLLNGAKPVKLGKISKKEAASVNFQTVQYKYLSQYLNSCPNFKFNPTKWAYMMKELGLEPYLKPIKNEQCAGPFKPEVCPHSKVHEWRRRLETDPSDKESRKNMAEMLWRSARRCEEKHDLKRAIACAEAANTLWKDDKLIMYCAVLKNILKQATEDNSKQASESLSFEAFSPNALEESINELDQEEEEERNAETSAARDASEEDSMDGSITQSKKKGQKSCHSKKCSRSKKHKRKSHKKIVPYSGNDSDSSQNIYYSREKHKEKRQR